MPEWLQNLLAAVGGGSVVLIGVLTIFKKLFLKLFETGIESSFEKSLEKYRNQLSRSTKAYEILLDREMRFYERLEPIFADLVPLLHDLKYCSTHKDDPDQDGLRHAFAEYVGQYGTILKTLKNETLVHQAYIPNSIFTASTAVVVQMQKDLTFWSDTAKYFFSGDYETINDEQKENVVSGVLALIAVLELKIKLRLEELSGIS